MEFPAEMLVDYVRVYQRKAQMNVGCDPQNYPTMAYIAKHPQAYTSTRSLLFRLSYCAENMFRCEYHVVDV